MSQQFSILSSNTWAFTVGGQVLFQQMFTSQVYGLSFWATCQDLVDVSQLEGGSNRQSNKTDGCDTKITPAN